MHLREARKLALYTIALRATVIGADAINAINADLNARARVSDDPRRVIMTIGPEIQRAAEVTHDALTNRGNDVRGLGRALREQLALFDIVLNDIARRDVPFRQIAKMFAEVVGIQETVYRALRRIEGRAR